MDFDEILPEVGEYGTYQKLVLWFLLVPGAFPCAFHAYNQLFMTTVPDHWCQTLDIEMELANASEKEFIRAISVPYDNETQKFSKCLRYDIDFRTLYPEILSKFSDTKEISADVRFKLSKANTIPCDRGWHYQLDQFTTSVVADWDLVCDQAFMPTLALILLGASGLVGNYIFGFVQDGLGRRPAFFIYLFIICAFGVGTAFAPSFNWWLGCRIGVGFGVPAILMTPLVLALELVGPCQRTYTTVVMNVAYSCSLIVLSIVTYFVRIWHQLALATSIPFIAFFGYWWVLPESPRWLMACGRLDEAFKIMSTMARVNKKPLRSDFLLRLKEKHLMHVETTANFEGKAKSSNYGIMDLLRTPNLRKKTLIITFIWFANTSVYVGLCYYAPALGGDGYLNFFLSGVSELPTFLVLWPAMEYWGRRWTLCISMVIGGSACIATVLTQNDHVVTLVLYCIGKSGISSSFVVLPLMASELYPTVVRGVGLGLSATAGMIGPVVIPLVNYLGTELMVLPLIIMGALLVIGGGSSLMLPETLHQNLPQTLEEGERFGKDQTTLRNFCNCCPRRRVKKLSKKTQMLAEEQKLQAKEEDEPRSLSEEEEFFSDSSYSSLRRNSFRRAQCEEISFEKLNKVELVGKENGDKYPKKKSKFRSSAKSSSMESCPSLKEHDAPLLQRTAKITVI